MIKTIFTFIITGLCVLQINAQPLNPEVFTLLDLNRKGLERVKQLHEAGQDKDAAAALLEYYRKRTGIVHPEVNPASVTITKEEQKMADEALEHRFFAHQGYQPSFFYGKDINWRYWPVKDNELRWQLHRHKWFSPMGKAYRVSKDEKYAREWTLEYMDWIVKNPLVEIRDTDNKVISSGEMAGSTASADAENARFAWRPLEVSHRLQDQTAQFLYFNISPWFTPEFLTQFLVNYYRHANHILHNYSAQGNHLLFESQRILYAGIFFPEFRDAAVWRQSGIAILNREIEKQVYADGMQFELDPHYHLACIDIFYKALKIADSNGLASEFPQSFIARLRKMIEAEYNLSFPDYSNPLFSDAKMNEVSEMKANYRRWLEFFKGDRQIEWFATNGKKGQLPPYNSNALKNSGFFIFRTGWTPASTVMMLKAGPPGEWHCQPDNGTFELWINGRNFFYDSGSYVYAGDSVVNRQRAWFRQTMVHKTLTLDNRTLETTDSKCLLWDTGDTTEKLVVENQSYKDLKHRRSVFFVDKKFFVIVDEATGKATGDVAVHYQLCEGKTVADAKNKRVSTLFDDGNNMQVQGFCNEPAGMVNEEGWVSYRYRQKAERKAFAYEVDKQTDKPVRFITVLYPVADGHCAENIKAGFNSDYSVDGLSVTVTIGKKSHLLTYSLK
jgi:heparan-sulfate lyase